MSATGMPIGCEFYSGSWVAVPRNTQPVERCASPDHPPVAENAGTDYCLFDAQGRFFGTIAAPRVTPVFGKAAATFYLTRSATRPAPSRSSSPTAGASS
jgi:hypothetical protein